MGGFAIIVGLAVAIVILAFVIVSVNASPPDDSDLMPARTEVPEGLLFSKLGLESPRG